MSNVNKIINLRYLCNHHLTLLNKTLKLVLFPSVATFFNSFLYDQVSVYAMGKVVTGYEFLLISFISLVVHVFTTPLLYEPCKFFDFFPRYTNLTKLTRVSWYFTLISKTLYLQMQNKRFSSPFNNYSKLSVYPSDDKVV